MIVAPFSGHVGGRIDFRIMQNSCGRRPVNHEFPFTAFRQHCSVETFPGNDYSFGVIYLRTEAEHMATRMRSPNYPGTPLREAIEIVGKIFTRERSNAIDRAVAAQAAGYTGISGRSAKVLSDLAQYGLLERAGKAETRVSRRAIEILHPDSPVSRRDAIRDAAYEPELFQRVKERFPDGLPSAGALRSYLLKEGFTDAALPSAIRAYLHTAEFVEQENASESHGVPADSAVESVENQRSTGEEAMNARSEAPKTPAGASNLNAAVESQMMFDWARKRVMLSRAITNQGEAREVIEFINAVINLLPETAAGKDEVVNEPAADEQNPMEEAAS